MPDLSQDALWYADRALKKLDSDLYERNYQVFCAAPCADDECNKIGCAGSSIFRTALSQAWLDGYSTRDKGES